MLFFGNQGQNLSPSILLLLPNANKYKGFQIKLWRATGLPVIILLAFASLFVEKASKVQMKPLLKFMAPRNITDSRYEALLIIIIQSNYSYS